MPQDHIMKRRLPHHRGKKAAADPGHRYQMWCKNGLGEDICIGYSDSATSFQQMIEIHPVWHSWRAVDRQPSKVALIAENEVGRSRRLSCAEQCYMVAALSVTRSRTSDLIEHLS